MVSTLVIGGFESCSTIMQGPEVSPEKAEASSASTKAPKKQTGDNSVHVADRGTIMPSIGLHPTPYRCQCRCFFRLHRAEFVPWQAEYLVATGEASSGTGNHSCCTWHLKVRRNGYYQCLIPDEAGRSHDRSRRSGRAEPVPANPGAADGIT